MARSRCGRPQPDAQREPHSNRPAIRLGWWPVSFAPAFLLVVSGRLMGPLGAIFRRRDRALMVIAATVLLLLIVAFVLAELVLGTAD